MFDNRKRIEALEMRVIQLEKIIREAGLDGSGAQRASAPAPRLENQNAAATAPMSETQTATALRSHSESPAAKRRARSASLNEKRKDSEAMIGKYLIGTLSAILIFVACASFASLIWDQVSDGVKLGLMLLFSFSASGAGFYMIQKKRSPIAAVTLGIGAGSLFISILSANLAFHMIGNNMSLVLAGAWAIGFILASQRSKLYFLTVIAYVGSFITLIFGLSLMQSGADFMLLSLFAICIAAVMLFTSWKANGFEKRTNTLLSLGNFTVLLVGGLADATLGSTKLIDSGLTHILLLVLIYGLMNLYLKLLASEKPHPLYLFINLAVTLLTGVSIGLLSEAYYDLSTMEGLLIFFGINLIQLAISRTTFQSMERHLTLYYGWVLSFGFMFIGLEGYESPAGISVIVMILLVSDLVLKRKSPTGLMAGILVLDAVLLNLATGDHVLCALIGLTDVGLFAYLLWQRLEMPAVEKGELSEAALKVMGLLVIVLSCFGTIASLGEALNFDRMSDYLSVTIGYGLAAASVIGLLAKGYFKPWAPVQLIEGIKDADAQSDRKVEADGKALSVTGAKRINTLKIASNGLLIILYIFGLFLMQDVDLLILQFVLTLSVLAVALVQSKELLLRENKDDMISGLWMVIKYLMFAWTAVWSYFDYSIDSVLYSVAGLMVAIAWISLGFYLKVKSVRLYGLVLTLVMVAKFIIVDLSGENSMTRVIALIVGGVLCFIISYIYNKLSTSEKVEDQN